MLSVKFLDNFSLYSIISLYSFSYKAYTRIHRVHYKINIVPLPAYSNMYINTDDTSKV